ncbi:thiamine pyrophosphate-binding protein [Paraburkholderia sp. Ac-20342]|uniref:thiamine pyrophosphate-binding protein n=1 Tax=Paraburkholderia sp. Ac-20342 TaxID=2703889 RepID=UPI00197EF967|nr:thiamine pyrophosphate-binding protein [Paraburkholderia sp. Ac-20342]MBN3846049.1 thiamine pyrophosphate-binding protein [Paraburkholderia sp. Ac-20342]
MSSRTGAQVLIEQLAARGVTRIFGVPGGDCSLDVIEAANEAGIEFVVTRTENSAAMMAAVTAELTGSLGVVLTTRGPGLANGVNGVAYAALDRAPIVLIGDGYEHEQAFISHQRFDQTRVLEPLIKGAARLDTPVALPAVGALLDTALSAPYGPVYLEVTGAGMRGTVPADAVPVQVARPVPAAPGPAVFEHARKVLAAARRPVIIAGLQAAEARASEALRRLAAKLQCPVLATYKAKGVLPDADPLMLGSYIGGAAEDETLRSADLFVLFGTDPVEFAPQPWRYTTPVLDIALHSFPRHYFNPVASVIGDLAVAAAQLEVGLARSDWHSTQLGTLKEGMRARALTHGGGPITPQSLTEAACAALPANARITVDAGAHMLPVMAHFQANAPRDVLISRGLATMAFALPAAIGAALAEPNRPVVAFTGDGGLMMCAAEFATAVQAGCKLTVVVFNDSSMTLIGVKQRRRDLPHAGVDYSHTDFAQVARGFGARGWRVEDPAQLADALSAALAADGPSVVDVVIDPEPYHAQIRSLRG